MRACPGVSAEKKREGQTQEQKEKSDREEGQRERRAREKRIKWLTEGSKRRSQPYRFECAPEARASATERVAYKSARQKMLLYMLRCNSRIRLYGPPMATPAARPNTKFGESYARTTTNAFASFFPRSDLELIERQAKRKNYPSRDLLCNAATLDPSVLAIYELEAKIYEVATDLFTGVQSVSCRACIWLIYY